MLLPVRSFIIHFRCVICHWRY